MRLFHIPLLLLLFLSSTLSAQINPPDLNCINGNGAQIEIFWTPPAATCGPITGYQIFYSDTQGGPYTSLVINDPSILDTTFASNATTVYCYMQSTMNCPGQVVVNSDTLIYTLTPPSLLTVSVNASNNVVVSWEANPSPDVAGYLIFDDAGIALDTVYGVNTTTFTDLVADPSLSSLEYKIAWFRDCDPNNPNLRRGSLGATYNSILLENLQQDKCDRSFTFGWNRYENYTAGVTGYAIDVSINSGAFTTIDTVAFDQLVYLYPDAINGNEYCFKVSALLPNNLVAYSNTVCDSATVADVPMGAHLRNATVINGTTIQVEYFPDTAGTLSDLNFQRSVDGNNYQTWPANLIGPSGTIPTYDIYQDVSSNPSSSDYFYRFRRLDECANEFFAEGVKTIHLDYDLGSSTPAIEGYDLSTELFWTPFEITNGTVVQYHIIKYMNGDSVLFGTNSGNDTTVVDDEALNSTQLDTICYQVIAEISLNIPGIVTTTTFSQSNIVCLNPTPKIVAPSGFRPASEIFMNKTFKPIIFFGTDQDYTFRVYDRWNRKVFETINPAEGWDGTINGKEAPIDMYVYYVSFLGQDGNTYSKAGAVALVR
ncbi:MAG: gliding motility-associated C-terminal domain-containing protein [Chitinophagales bacterium]